MLKTINRTGKYLTISLLCIAGIFSSYAQVSASGPDTQGSIVNGASLTNSQDIINYIEEHTEYVFLYNGNIDFTKILVSIDVKDKNVDEIIKETFKNTNIVYEIDGKQIILTEKKLIEQPSIQTPKERTIRGIVIDAETQEPLIGVGVVSKRTNKGVVTNLDGEFSLSCQKGEVLKLSYIGYTDFELEISDRNIYTVEMKSDVTTLDEVVVTAFGVAQKKENMVGAIEQIRPDDMKIPSAQLTNAFAGRLAGVIAVQRSGEPGADGSNFWIRGKSTFSGATGALIIIDGMQASVSELNALDPEVIDGFSILKDATATAMYGTLGANGVMVVTTKRGEILDKPVINFRIEGSMSQLSRVPQMVGGVEFMNLYNEAAMRPDAAQEPYSDLKIQNTLNGSNKILYPDINWYDELFKKNSWGQKVNFNIRGGGRKADYFMSLSFKHNNGNLKPLSRDYFSFNNNIHSIRYDFVNNLNVRLTKTTKLSLGLNVGVHDYSGPAQSPSRLFGMVMEANPVSYPISYPGSPEDTYVKWGGMTGGAQGVAYPNPVAELVSGVNKSLVSTVTANLKLEQDLSMITEGLRASASFYFKNTSSSGTTRSAFYNQFEIDTLNPETGDYTLSMVGNEKKTSLETKANGNGGSRKMYFQAIIDYNRVFNKVHDVSAMLLYNQEQNDTNVPIDLYTSLPQRKLGFAGRISYGYGNRYMVEANFGYNGSENFAKGHRFGFFPSVGLGYNMSGEKFWKPIKRVFNKFKIRASWGLVGNDNTGAGRFAYMEDIELGTSDYWYSTGIPGAYLNRIRGPQYKRFYNPELTWEVGEKINVGFDMGFFNSLNINIEWFQEMRRNIFQQRKNTTSGLLGISKSVLYGNIGKMKNEGVDLSLDYNKQINRDWYVSFKGTFTYAHNTVLEHDEPSYVSNPNLSIKGGSVGRHLVYVCNGIFPDQETIDANPRQTLGSTPIPGDLWYQDIADAEGNYNGIINSDDRVYMGMPRDPEIVYGFGPSIKYKNFDFSFFFQGVGRTSLLMSGFYPFGDKKVRGVPEYVAKDCWRVDNPNPNATFPRLKIDNNQNNEVASSHWLRDASFLKLKNVEIGYTFKKMRFYISGANLATFSKFKFWDPEMGGGNGMKYPTQMTFNIGFQMTIN